MKPKVSNYLSNFLEGLWAEISSDEDDVESHKSESDNEEAEGEKAPKTDNN